MCALRPVLDLSLAGAAALRAAVAPRLGTLRAPPVSAAFVGARRARRASRRAPDEASAQRGADAGDSPTSRSCRRTDVATQLDRSSAEQIARDLVANLGNEADAAAAPRSGPRDGRRRRRAARLGLGAHRRGRLDGRRTGVRPRAHDGRRSSATTGRAPPLVVADVEGTVELVDLPRIAADGAGARTTRAVPTDARARARGRPLPDRRLARTDAAALWPPGAPSPRRRRPTGLRLDERRGGSPGCDFRHGAFRFDDLERPGRRSMGGGLCWLDYDDDGWLDLYVVNSYSIERDFDAVEATRRHCRGARSSTTSAAGSSTSAAARAPNVSLRGNGCVAADLNGDGRTDLYVTATGYDALLWNRGDGTFVEGARAAGIATYGWHSGAAVGDVNGDGRPDLYVGGLRRPEQPGPGRSGRLPEQLPAPSRPPLPQPRPGREGALALPRGRGGRQASRRSRSTTASVSSSPTTTATDGSTSTSRTTRTRTVCSRTSPPTGPLGFRLRGATRRSDGVADSQAGMGVASADFNRRRRPDLFVTNSHRQLHGVFGSRGSGFADARRDLRAGVRHPLRRLGRRVVRSRPRRRPGRRARERGDPGAEPRPRRRAGSGAARTPERQVVDVSEGVLGTAGLRVNGRGLAAADYDNDGDVDVAINSIGGPLALLRNAGSRGHWLEVAFERFSPGARVTRRAPGRATPGARGRRPGAATSRRRTRACTSASAGPRG